MRIYIQTCKVCGLRPQAKYASGMCGVCIKRFLAEDLHSFEKYIRRFYVWPVNDGK